MVKKIAILYKQYSHDIVINEYGRPYDDKSCRRTSANGDLYGFLSYLKKYKKRSLEIILKIQDSDLEQQVIKIIKQINHKAKFKK